MNNQCKSEQCEGNKGMKGLKCQPGLAVAEIADPAETSSVHMNDLPHC